MIPTSSADKQNIVLKAGQKVMVLKSPKGIYMQLETGKIIAIRTSMKPAGNGNPQNPSAGILPEKPPTFTSMQESAQTNNLPPNLRNQALMTKNPRYNYPANSLGRPKINDDEVINISNDESEDENEEGVASKKNSNLNSGSNSSSSQESQKDKPDPAVIIQSVETISGPVIDLETPPVEETPDKSASAEGKPLPVVNDTTYKEKVFRPNLVGRKAKVPVPPTESSHNIPPFNYQPQPQQKGNFRSHTNPEQPLPATTKFNNNFSHYQSNSYPATSSGSSRFYGNNSNYNYNDFPSSTTGSSTSNSNNFNSSFRSDYQKRNPQQTGSFRGRKSFNNNFYSNRNPNLSNSSTNSTSRFDGKRNFGGFRHPNQNQFQGRFDNYFGNDFNVNGWNDFRIGSNFSVDMNQGGIVNVEQSVNQPGLSATPQLNASMVNEGAIVDSAKKNKRKRNKKNKQEAARKGKL